MPEEIAPRPIKKKRASRKKTPVAPAAELPSAEPPPPPGRALWAAPAGQSLRLETPLAGSPPPDGVSGRSLGGALWAEPPGGARPEIAASLENIYRHPNAKQTNLAIFDIKPNHPVLRFFTWFLILGGLASAAAAIGWGYLNPGNKTLGDNVAVAISAPAHIILGTNATLTIDYENKEAVAIRNTVLQVYYPAGFIVANSSLPPTNEGKNEWLLGTIPPNTKGSLTVTGQFFGPIGVSAPGRALLSYRPDGFNSTFQKNTRAEFTIASSPFQLALSAPASGAVGETIIYSASVQKPADSPATGLSLRVNTPVNFQITTSTVAFKNNRAALSTQQFSTSTNRADLMWGGVWSNDTEDNNAAVNIQLLLTPPGSAVAVIIAEATVTTTLTKNQATLTLAVNGSTSPQTIVPGDGLAVTLAFVNNGSATLKNGLIKAVFEGPAIGKTSAFDWANLVDAKNGALVGEAIKTGLRRGTITWDQTQIPALKNVAPGQTVLVDVKLPLRDQKNFDWANLVGAVNFKITGTARFTDENNKTVDIDNGGLTLGLRSDVSIQTRDNTETKNSPTHLITWVINNNLHPLKNLTLTGTLFGNVTFTPPTTTPAGNITYDKKNQTLVWTIPQMPAGVDVLALSFTVTLNKLNPTQTTLVSKVHFKATDEVSGEAIELTGAEVPLLTSN